MSGKKIALIIVIGLIGMALLAICNDDEQSSTPAVTEQTDGGSKAWSAETLPVPANVADTNLVNYVSNPDGILTQASVDSINHIMFHLQKTMGVQGLVIAVKKINPDDPYEFTMQVGKKHGIGGTNSTGFILMVASESRAYEILTGSGMEKFLTDGQCSQISRRYMVPLLKEAKWGEAVMAGVTAVQGVLEGEIELKNDAPDAGSSNGNPNKKEEMTTGKALGGFMFINLIIGIIIFVRVRKKTHDRREWLKEHSCPECKQTNYALMMRQVVLAEGEETAPTDEQINQLVSDNLPLVLDYQKKLDAWKEAKKTDKSLRRPAALYLNKGITDTMNVLNEDKVKRPQKVRIVCVGHCPDCGYVHQYEEKGTTYDYKLGCFYGATFSQMKVVHLRSYGGGGSDSGSSYRDNDSSSYSSRSYSSRSSSSSSGSWGSSGGGSFSGGGAGGRF